MTVERLSRARKRIDDFDIGHVPGRHKHRKEYQNFQDFYQTPRGIFDPSYASHSTNKKRIYPGHARCNASNIGDMGSLAHSAPIDPVRI